MHQHFHPSCPVHRTTKLSTVVRQSCWLQTAHTAPTFTLIQSPAVTRHSPMRPLIISNDSSPSMLQRQISKSQDSRIQDQTKYKVGIPTCDNWFSLTAATGVINQFRHFVSPKRVTAVTLQRAVTVCCTAGALLAAANMEVVRSSSYLLTVQNKMVHSDTTSFNIKKL